MCTFDQKQEEAHQPLSPTSIRLAIVGAGYAGLALANLLIKYNHQNDFVILDALHPPSPLSGDLRVPVAKKLYQRLGWKWTFVSDNVIPEETLQRDLRRNVSQILYQHFCYKIEEVSDNNQLSLLVWNRKTNECFRYPHTFQIVIICNGVRSKLMGQVPHGLSDRILLLGDARSSRTWDFGRHRIAQGANQALQDAMEVSQLLSRNATDWGKFGIEVKRREIMKRRTVVAMLLGAIFYLVWMPTIRNKWAHDSL